MITSNWFAKHCRRFLIHRVALSLAGLLLLVIPRNAASGQTAGDGSKSYSWQTTITPQNEPGEPLVVSGTIYRADGKTPIAGALLYVYQTDAEGYYRKGSSGSDNPRLKGWMKTNADGKYELHTIKPGSYPGSRNPAHIHAKVTVPGHPEQWIDEFHFEGDPFLNEAHVRKEIAKGRFSSVMRMRRDAGGTIRCERDIRLTTE